MCFNKNLEVHRGKNLSEPFLIHNDLKEGDALSPLLFNFPLEYAITKIQGIRKDWNSMKYILSWPMLMMLLH
jgi:hypothetical protein